MTQSSPQSKETKSPAVANVSGSQGAFIYPIRSAVSVKPTHRDLSSDTASSTSRRSVNMDEEYTVRGGSELAFELRTSNSENKSKNTVEKGDLDSEDSLTSTPTPQREVGWDDTPIEDSGSSPSWEGDEEVDVLKAEDSHHSVEDSRKMKEGSEPSDQDEADTVDRRRLSTQFSEAKAKSREKDMLEKMTQPRFRHVETEHGHMVVTGRDGDIQRCEDEPIHIPGAVQSYGCMIVVREDEEGMLAVRQVSENTGEILGLSPAYLFTLESFLDCLDDDQADILWMNIEASEESDQELIENGPHVFKLSGWGQPGPGNGKARARRHWECWCAVHQTVGIPHDLDESKSSDPKWKKALTVMEFELVKDVANPLEEKTPLPSPEILDSSTENKEKQLSTGGSTISPTATVEESEGTTKVTSVTISSKSRGGLEGMPYIPTPKQYVESTQSSSRPIKALQRLRQKSAKGDKSSRRQRSRSQQNTTSAPGFGIPQESGSGDSIDMFGILSQVNEQLSAQNDLQSFLKLAVSVIRDVTGFSRVMMYQFDERWNGQVVAELVDWNDTHDLYRGLHFPATDIPKQARDLYMVNKIRLLYDRDQPSSRMVCRDLDDLNTPVNMTHSFLRAMSPIHIKYLANMGVRASMSISITAFDQLWGLVAMHTYGSRGKRVSFPMRQLCKLIGEAVSRNIERLSYTRRLSARKLINTLPTDRNPSGYIISNAEDLLTLFDADFGVIAIGNEAKILGPLSASQEVLAITEYLRLKKYQHVVTSQDILSDFPDMILPIGLEVIAGLILVPLSSTGIDFIAFLRKAQTRHVNWAGKPYKAGKEGAAVLEPRKSFKIWSENIVGTCRAWKDEELETASVLCLVYGKFISVWRQREQAMHYNQLNKLLLTNATHEVRTPLNHIINYLEMALDSTLDEDTRENLSKSHMASKSLLFVINDLLDLTRHEEGNKLLLQEPFDLAATIRDAVEMHEWEAKRRKIEFAVETIPEKLFVIGDAARIRQIVVNTVSNSVKHTSQGHIHISMRKKLEEEITGELPDGCDIEVELIISDTGEGISREKLEAIFREFEQVESVIAAPPTSREGEEDDEFARKSDVFEESALATQKSQKEAGIDSGLGLGLAIVARIVKNLGGQLRVDSTVGQGSRFAYYLPFRASTVTEAAEASESSEAGMGRSQSMGSEGSNHSSTKSGINSLVEAIAAPHLSNDRSSPLRRDSYDSEDGSASESNTSGQLSAIGRTESRGINVSASSLSRSLQQQQGGMLDGVAPLTGLTVPLRSVKVEPQELDRHARGMNVLPQRQASTPLSPQSQQNKRNFDAGQKGIQTQAPSDFRLPNRKELMEGSKGISPRTEVSISSDSAGLPGLLSGASSTSSNSKRRMIAEARAKSQESKSDIRTTEKLSSLRILIVEDDPINRMILKKRLVMDGHTVLLAVNGEEGVRQFMENGNEMDVILMDLQMPICNGQDACRRIRACELARQENDQLANRPAAHILNGRIPILAVSATLEYRMRREMCDIGMDGWLLKPIDFARLKTIMTGLIHVEQRELEKWKPGHIWERGGWLSEPAYRPLEGGANRM
ncbi:hypothetical protein CBS101457_004253 [Exobasidium rhododendri]|nr:hypothetical protein CBS101457_004253 [Exobasidium rhododendri]